MASVRRQPKGRHTSRTGSSSTRCCLLAQREGERDDRPPGTVPAHQQRPPHDPGQQQRLGPRLLDLGDRARREQQERDRGSRRPGRRASPDPAPAERSRPTTAHQRPGQQGPADVTGQPPARRQQHRGPRQVGEGVLDAGGAVPGHRVDVLPVHEPVGGLLQGHPDVDPGGRVADDRRDRTDQVRRDGDPDGDRSGPRARPGEQRRAGQGAGRDGGHGRRPRRVRRS